MLVIHCVVIVVLFIYSVVQAANVQIKLEGLNDVLKSYIDERLSSITTNNIDIDQYFRDDVCRVVCFGLRSLGYYSPTIKLFLDPLFTSYSSNKQENYTLVVHVEPGLPVKVSKVNINFRGDICYDNDYQQLLIESQSYIGQVLTHAKYENFKNKLLNLSLSKGYFDAKFYKSQFVVLPVSYQSFWNINFDSGQRYFFGDIRFYGGVVKRKYLKNLFYIRSGMYYDNQALIECNRRLFATNWFHSVVISPNHITANRCTIKNIPLDVFFTPAISNNVEFSLGYSTDITSQLKVVWKNPCINSYGHSIKNTFSCSIPEQFIDFNYKIPLVRSPILEYYILQGVVRHEKICNNKQPDVVFTMNVSRYWNSIDGWNRSINIHYCFDYCNGNLGHSKSIMLIYPGISMYRVRQRGGMMPVWGDSQRYSIDISSDFWCSEVDFFLFQSRNIWIRTLLNKHRVIIRNNLGWMRCNDFQSIFPFARRCIFVNHYLIRGYKYQFLFLKNILFKQEFFFASKPFFSSFEYQYNILEKWWSVLFIDGGNIFNRHVNDNFHFKFGIGFGVRWQSPLGPARLDLAIPALFFNNTEIIRLNLLHVYVSLGPEL